MPTPSVHSRRGCPLQVCTAGGYAHSKCAGQEGRRRATEGLSAHIAPSCPSLQAKTPKAMRGSKDAAPKEETAVLSREERQVGAPREEPASLIPGAKRVTEKEEEVAGTPGWQVRKPGAQLEHRPHVVLLGSPWALQGGVERPGSCHRGNGWGRPGHPKTTESNFQSGGATALCGAERCRHGLSNNKWI